MQTADRQRVVELLAWDESAFVERHARILCAGVRGLLGRRHTRKEGISA